MKIDLGKIIKIEYELAVEGGEIIESSDKSGPLEYDHGNGHMLPALEAKMDGLEEGAEIDGVLPPEEAYGREQDLPTRDIPRAEFPEGEEVEKGKAFEAKGADGNPVTFVIVEADDDKVTVRFRHPLTDKSIRYKVKILSVREPGEPPPPPPAPAD